MSELLIRYSNIFYVCLNLCILNYSQLNNNYFNHTGLKSIMQIKHFYLYITQISIYNLKTKFT